MRTYGGRFVFGHRGLPGLLPENTLISFLAAAAVGATGVEFDLHLTADGEVVVLHDDALDRTTTGSGDVERLTLAEVRAVSAGARTHPRFAAERVPTLAETLALAADFDLAVDLELKVSARGEALVQATVAAVEAFFASRPEAVAHPGGEGFLVTSFDPDLVAVVRRMRPKWRTGLLVDAPPAPDTRWVRDQVAAARQLGADFLLPPLEAVMARPEAWRVDHPFIAFGGAFPLDMRPDVVGNPLLAGVIVDDPHVAATCLMLWRQGSRAT